MVNPVIQTLIDQDKSRVDYIKWLEAKVATLSRAIADTPDAPAGDVFGLIPPDKIAESVTISQIHDGWLRGLLLNVSEAGIAAGTSNSRISEAYRTPGSYLPSIRVLPGDPSRTNRTTLFYIGWLAQKWPDGPGCRAWRSGLDDYQRWVRSTIDRPD